MGIRPENVSIGAGPPPDGALAGVVYIAEPTGAETWVTLDVRGERVTGRAPADFAARAGQPAWLRFEPERVLRFDAETRARIEDR